MEIGPIGIFDSGYGGLTVFRDIARRLPDYDYLYLGDNARAPYGDKDFDTVYAITLQCVTWFLEKGCPLVILACNTASARALRTIQQKVLPVKYPDRRVLGVIRPTSEIIGEFSRTGHIGVLGTRGTVDSASYLIEIEKFFPQSVVHQQACPEWVRLVEEHRQDSEEAAYWVEKHLHALLERDPQIDTLLLACTHYPLLMPTLQRYVPSGVRLVAQGDLVAESLADYLQRHPEIEHRCTRSGRRTFHTTGGTEDFNRQATMFFGSEVQATRLFLG